MIIKMTMIIKKILLAFVFMLLISIMLFAPSDDVLEAQTPKQVEIDSFYICNIEGVIDPSISNYIKKCISQAEDDNRGLLIMMDTPGGLETSMREIILEMINSEIPILTYVSPEGARAASAGTFIVYSSDVAFMAPSSNIGAAHPVDIAGQAEGAEDAMEKVTNDSVALIKNLAKLKNRNEEWAEKAVRESSSITAIEALDIGVIEYIAEDDTEVFSIISGQTITKGKTEFIFSSSGIETTEKNMSFVSRFLHIISNPNIAYILFIIGVLGIIYEFSQPGLGVSGAIGVVCIIIGFYALSILPINYAGLALMGLAIILFVLDVKLNVGGILSIVGIAAFLFGSFLLIDTQVAYLRIATWLIIGVTAGISAFLIIVIRAIFKIHIKKPVTGAMGILGNQGIVIEDLDPEGLIKTHGEIWRAVSIDDTIILKEDMVEVLKIEGLILYVKRLDNNKKKE